MRGFDGEHEHETANTMPATTKKEVASHKAELSLHHHTRSHDHSRKIGSKREEHHVSSLINHKPARVVKLRRSKGQVVQGCDVYIGRRCARGGWDLPESKWHCPFTMKECGSAKEIVRRYREYVLNRPDLLDSLHELDGKVLGCWCKNKPTDHCHGDVLVELLEQGWGTRHHGRAEQTKMET